MTKKLLVKRGTFVFEKPLGVLFLLDLLDLLETFVFAVFVEIVHSRL